MANHLTLLPSKLVCLDDILRYLILKGQNRVLTQRIVRLSLCPLNDDIVSFYSFSLRFRASTSKSDFKWMRFVENNQCFV